MYTISGSAERDKLIWTFDYWRCGKGFKIRRSRQFERAVKANKTGQELEALSATQTNNAVFV
jgi:hypothetical protein